ncbi:Fe-S cluster assembly ATPase SufC [Rothia kristinae]|uniref:Fe-S cluster assembly ATPase SufC n=1 Tax=Rothia kristinae TaxID=37923 RepID=UPI003AFFD372
MSWRSGSWTPSRTSWPSATTDPSGPCGPHRLPFPRRNPLSTLEIKDLHVSVILDDENTKPILKGVNLTINPGEIHAIMGPNGSGKSTLASTIAGHPKYRVDSGEILLDGDDVTEMSVDERARAGLFLAMQYPVEIPGVTMSNFLRSAKTAVDGEAPALRTWTKDVKAAMGQLKIDPVFVTRNVNEGFSGGEKKRHEILQLELLKPKFAILDETDSGLDIDALQVVSEGVNRAHDANDMGVMLITHYTRILRYIKPDFVHVFVDGKMADQGGPELAERLEEEGYVNYLQNREAAQA